MCPAWLSGHNGSEAVVLTRAWIICSKSPPTAGKQLWICVWSVETKISEAVKNISRIWQQTTAGNRLTQIAFCDISTPAPDRFNVYDEIKARLIERGVPEKEIAYIHDADTDARKKTLFDAVNAGRVRILLGS